MRVANKRTGVAVPWGENAWGSVAFAAMLWMLIAPAVIASKFTGPWHSAQATPLLTQFVAAAGSELDSRATHALTRIAGTDRQLLALRSYLRAGAALKSRWSWTEAEIARYERSAEHRRLQADIEHVRDLFERRNRGYTLVVNSRVRSLDEQIERWNHNDSVAQAARELAAAVESEMRTDGGLRSLSPASTQRFAELLRRTNPQSAPALAAPGLSRHGQMRAVDFAVRKGTEIVAGADTRTATRQWLAQGWSKRLQAAVVESRGPFTGPLREPMEPWHYDYEPKQ